MPFKSKKQEDYLRINEPEVYKRWKKRYDNGGINLNVAPGVSINVDPQGIGATIEGETTIQGNIPFSKNQDASILIEQEIDVGDDGRVSVNLWKTGGRGGGVGVEGRLSFSKGGTGEKEEASESAEKDFDFLLNKVDKSNMPGNRAWTGTLKDGEWVPHPPIKENRKKWWIPKDVDIEDLIQPLNKGGMAGCPMDGAVIKGGTTIKPERYTHGKRKV